MSLILAVAQADAFGSPCLSRIWQALPVQQRAAASAHKRMHAGRLLMRAGEAWTGR